MKKFYQITTKSFEELKVKNIKELWNKVKGDYTGLSVGVDAVFKAVEDEDGEKVNNKYNVIMSTEKEDRHGDIVKQNWDLKPFKKNPVFLDSHNYNSIEHILGKVNKTKVKDNKLQGEIEFMLDNPKGDLANKMVAGGFLNTVSVGFIPLEFDKDYTILKSELLELSGVSVPAQAEALIEQEKQEKKIEEKKVIIVEKSLKIKKLNAVKNFADKKEKRNKELIKEALVVIQQLNQRGVDAQTEKRMVNRAIKQLIKVK